MRALVVCLIGLAAACASAAPDAPRESIEVVYSETMRYSIEDGGSARLVGGDDHPVYEFQASREAFRRIAELIDPLQDAGLRCSEPSEHIAPGYIVWRRSGEEVRRIEMHTICYADGARPLARNTDQAWRMMEDLGHANYVAPAIPNPVMITLENMYWGRATSAWSIPRGGEGRYVDPQRTVTFQVSEQAFARVREILRPYEGRDFHCNRVLTDGPYGFVSWSSRAGQEDQRTRWDAGCVTGDASDLFERIDTAMEILVPLRDAAGEP